MYAPALVERARDGISLLVDPAAQARGLLVAFTDRRGGVSAEPYRSLNLALRVGDVPERVTENRRRVALAAGFDIDRLALARQVHGAEVMPAGPGDAGVLGEADGLIARNPGAVLGILTADCAPVVVAGRAGIGVLHAGWRGVVAGVVERGVEALGGVERAWIGPSIRACCYEVGPEVVDAFRARDLPVAGDRRVDPASAAATLLWRAGVDEVFVSDECTSCKPRYFSYRRDGMTGRQGAFVALTDATS